MTETAPKRNLLWLTIVAVVLGACVRVTTTESVQQPKLLTGSEAGGAIVTAPNMRPKRLAIVHCAQYKRHAVLRDVQRVGDSVAGSWESRAYVVYFDCM